MHQPLQNLPPMLRLPNGTGVDPLAVVGVEVVDDADDVVNVVIAVQAGRTYVVPFPLARYYLRGVVSHPADATFDARKAAGASARRDATAYRTHVLRLVDWYRAFPYRYLYAAYWVIDRTPSADDGASALPNGAWSWCWDIEQNALAGVAHRAARNPQQQPEYLRPDDPRTIAMLDCLITLRIDKNPLDLIGVYGIKGSSNNPVQPSHAVDDLPFTNLR